VTTDHSAAPEPVAEPVGQREHWAVTADGVQHFGSRTAFLSLKISRACAINPWFLTASCCATFFACVSPVIALRDPLSLGPQICDRRFI
jgi:hypothetical protein